MENYNNLSEELLKIDGIDPASVSNTERAMFKAMLDKEMKHFNRLSWLSVSLLWIFFIALLGLCLSERALEVLHIPFVIAWAIVIIGMYVILILLWPNHFRKIKASGKKVQRLRFIVHGKYRGFPLVGKKDGKRYIDWLSIILLVIALWLIISLGSAGVYYLLCRRWVFSTASGSAFHIFFMTIMSLAFVMPLLYRGLKAPLEELTEIKAENYSCSRRKFSIITLAVIIIACFIGLHFWSSTGSGIALAEVLATIEKVTAYSYKTNTVITGSKVREERTSKILVSKEHGIKIVQTTDSNDPESQPGDTYILPKQNAMVFIAHKEKFYTRIKFNNDSELEDYKEQNNDPNIIVKNFLSCQYTRLGLSNIDGIKVEGFRTTDPNYNGGFATISDFMGTTEKIQVELWVDVKTLLPVHLVEDSYKRYSKKELLHFYEVSSDFQWDVVVNPDDFNPVKPEGYNSIGDLEDLVIPEFDEETTIKSLKLFINIAGAYPANLNMMNTEYKKLMGIDNPSDWEKYLGNEATKKAGELILLSVPGYFYQELVEENKEPAYYGEMMGLDDSDKVLLRWKLDGGQYRVIFGDLSAKTVTAEELAGFEKP